MAVAEVEDGEKEKLIEFGAKLMKEINYSAASFEHF